MRILALLLLFSAPLEALPWQPFTALAIAADGKTFATGGSRGEVILWESVTGEPLGRWTLDPGLPVVAVAVEGGSVAAALLDGRLLWAEAGATGAYPAALTGAAARWLASSPLTQGVKLAGRELWVTGSTDGRIAVGRGNDTTATWSGHVAAVTGLALSPDGTVLLSCSYDGSVARWDARTGRLLGRL